MNLVDILSEWGITSEFGIEFSSLTILILCLLVIFKFLLIIWSKFSNF